ncbi:MAG: hypothetical protein QOJ20_4829 [Mycobacterium sp.]|jgi:hypothetical protein|nr:hypothetical protein [Mycobacterium sp.]
MFLLTCIGKSDARQVRAHARRPAPRTDGTGWPSVGPEIGRPPTATTTPRSLGHRLGVVRPQFTLSANTIAFPIGFASNSPVPQEINTGTGGRGVYPAALFLSIQGIYGISDRASPEAVLPVHRSAQYMRGHRRDWVSIARCNATIGGKWQQLSVRAAPADAARSVSPWAPWRYWASSARWATCAPGRCGPNVPTSRRLRTRPTRSLESGPRSCNAETPRRGREYQHAPTSRRHAHPAAVLR